MTPYLGFYKVSEFLSNFKSATFKTPGYTVWKYEQNWTKIVDFLLIALNYPNSKLGWWGLYTIVSNIWLHTFLLGALVKRWIPFVVVQNMQLQSCSRGNISLIWKNQENHEIGFDFSRYKYYGPPCDIWSFGGKITLFS